MNQVTRHDFESEKIKIDYLTFNIKNTEHNLQKIAQFFNRVYKFNCYYYDQKIGIKSKKPYLSLTNPSYTLEMVFVFHSNPGNRNTILIQFSGHNASQFYTILKSQKFNWQIFNLNDLTLGRLDINYIMLNQIIDESNLLSFFKRSADKFKSRYPNSNPQIIGTTLGLGTRTGDFFLRVYPPDNISLKFELEIKKYKAKQVTPFLINNCFAEFENSVVDSFLRYLKIALVFDTSYTDWFLRIVRYTHKPADNLISSYMDEKLVTTSNEDKLFFYRTIQLLSFARTCQLKQKVKVKGEILNTFSFPLTEFAKQIGLHPLNSYQRKNLLEFFHNLQDLPPIYEWFSDSEFRSSIVFPIIRVTNETSKHTKLIINITVCEGESRAIKSKELKKTVFAKGYDAGVVPAENLVPCPVQDDSAKFQRERCGLITDQSVEEMRDKLIDLTTSRKDGRVKLQLDMPFYDTEKATAYMDINTGDCAFYHEDSRKYWSYVKYDKNGVLNILANSDSVKYAKTSNSNSEL